MKLAERARRIIERELKEGKHSQKWLEAASGVPQSTIWGYLNIYEDTHSNSLEAMLEALSYRVEIKKDGE